MKSIITAFVVTYLVMMIGFRLVSAGSVAENAKVILDANECSLVSAIGAPISDCSATVNLSTTVVHGNYLLEFPNGTSIEVDQKKVRAIAFSGSESHRTAWHWLVTVGGWLLIFGWAAYLVVSAWLSLDSIPKKRQPDLL